MPKVYKERRTLSWPAFAPTQDRGAFDDLVPGSMPRYWSKLVIKKNEGRPVMSKMGPQASTGSYLQPPSSKHYIFPSTCGALTISCGNIEFEPGTGSALSGAHWHTCEEAFHVVSGRCWFEIEGERYHLEEGDWIFVPPQTRHCHMNSGTETLRLVFVKGIRLRAYDGPTETPIDYREFDVVDEPDTPAGDK